MKILAGIRNGTYLELDQYSRICNYLLTIPYSRDWQSMVIGPSPEWILKPIFINKILLGYSESIYLDFVYGEMSYQYLFVLRLKVFPDGHSEWLC